jgi:long-chain acyl-CoA synthetase
MLYELWIETVGRFASETALIDLATNRRWTFQSLAKEVEGTDQPAAEIVYPQGNSVEFITSLLNAWRFGKLTCPLEPSQRIISFEKLPGDCAHLKLTSATTGQARAVLFKPEQLLADVKNIVSTMGLRPEWPNFGVISMAHSYGFSNLVLPLFFFGIPLVLAPAPLPEILKKADFPALTIAAVPALWRTWNSAGALTSKIRLAVSAGAPLPISLEQEVFREFGLKIHNFYGSTECGGIAYDRSAVPRAESTLAGAAMDNVTLSVSPEGTLVVEGRAVGERYWPDHADELAAGRFTTSDLVEIRNGQVHLLGRATEIINVAGRKVAPQSIEDALLQNPAVGECLVFGVPDEDPDRVERIVACVVLRKSISEIELKSYVSRLLPGWQVPREFWFVESLQTNERGKVSRAKWKKNFLNVEKKN